MEYCDFILYTNEDIHVERIGISKSFIAENIAKAQILFENSILLELLGRWFSRPPPADATPSSLSCTNEVPVAIDNDATVYCYCQEGEHGEMVGCDNCDCPYQWFHLSCLKLAKPPKGKIWYCPDCRKLDKFQRKSKKSTD